MNEFKEIIHSILDSVIEILLDEKQQYAHCYVDCNPERGGQGSPNSLWMEIPFSGIIDAEKGFFENERDKLVEGIFSEVKLREFFEDDTSLESIKNLTIELIRIFFDEGFGIDVDFSKYHEKIFQYLEW